MKNILGVMSLLLLLGSLLSASSVSYKVSETTKANARLEKNAVVCKSHKSLTYLLKSEKNYRKITHGLRSNSFYKNCFLSIVSANVTVSAQYNDRNLIKNYYVINKHTGKTRYVPIEFIEPLRGMKKSTRKYYKKNKKKYKKSTKKYNKKSKKIYRKKVKASSKIKKSSKLKKHTKKKKSKKSYKTKQISPTRINTTRQSIHTGTQTIVNTKVNENIEKKNNLKSISSSSSEQKEDISTTSNGVVIQKEKENYMKVYRCSTISFDESFMGEHIDKESSKKMALANCKKYQKQKSLCVFENCFILRVDLD